MPAAFNAEIDRYVERVMLAEYFPQRLKQLARYYLSGMKSYRRNPAKASDVLRKTEDRLVYLNSSGRGCIWQPHDFIFADPFILEERLVSQFMQERGNLILPSGFAFSIFDIPSEVIATAYEIHTLRNKRVPLLRYKDSYEFLDEVVEKDKEHYQKGSKLAAESRRRLESYVRQLKRHAGDIEGMAGVIRRHLDYKTDKLGANPREYYVDPFYPHDMLQLQFPSAHADFIAARFIACAQQK